MKKLAFFLTCGTLFLVSCKKDFLDTKPNSSTILDPQIRELANAPGGLTKIADPSIKGMYAFMHQYATYSSNHDDFGQKAVDLGLDLMTEDMVQSVHHWFGFDYLIDNREATYRRTHFLWNFYYSLIYSANDIIDKIDPNTTEAALKFDLGQALAIRAYSHFYLVQLFQNTYKGHEGALGVPVYTSNETLEGKPRSTVAEVYDQIQSDLNAAIPLLQGFSRTSKEAIDQSVVYGMQARVYLSMEKWMEAEQAANAALAGYSLMSNADYKAGFSNINNSEWMWGADINSESTTIYASFFSMMDNTTPGYAGALGVYKLISKKLYDQIPATDVRKQVFNDPASTINADLPGYAQLKFIDPGGFTGDYVYMRVAEMYLIKAEAQARQNKDQDAQQTLYTLISNRDAGYVKSTNTGQALIDEIILQKRIELWGEGITFLDIKRLKEGINRTGSNHRSDATLVIPAEDPKLTYKIPQREFETNLNMPASQQNP